VLRYTAGRLGGGALTLLGVSILVFLALYLAPGDPAAIIAGPQAGEDEIRAIRERFRLDDPLPVQYANWASRLVRGDFGVSYRGGRPVWPDLAGAFPVSVQLALGGLVIAVILGVPAGVLAAVRRDGVADATVMSLAVAGISIPTFWIALLLVLLFSVELRWLPSSGWGTLRHAILPVFCISLSSLALLARLTRSAMVEVLLEDYVRTARAKGLAERLVRYRHALRNTLLPIVTVIGLRFGALAGGAVVIESIFAVPGVGRLVVAAVANRDFPVVQGGVLLIAAVITLVNLGVDLAYVVLDPRITYE
jgi:ABC-type dipeptide/oligopeptide/nickel transport system permease component